MHRVWRGDAPNNVTETEYALLRIFALNLNRVLTNNEILSSVLGPGYGDINRLFRVYISNLRRKI